MENLKPTCAHCGKPRRAQGVHVVTENDFPAAVFRSREAADTFVKRQATRTINNTPIYWRINKFELD